MQNDTTRLTVCICACLWAQVPAPSLPCGHAHVRHSPAALSSGGEGDQQSSSSNSRTGTAPWCVGGCVGGWAFWEGGRRAPSGAFCSVCLWTTSFTSVKCRLTWSGFSAYQNEVELIGVLASSLLCLAEDPLVCVSVCEQMLLLPNMAVAAPIPAQNGCIYIASGEQLPAHCATCPSGHRCYGLYQHSDMDIF